jgi:hypothetical protein
MPCSIPFDVAFKPTDELAAWRDYAHDLAGQRLKCKQPSAMCSMAVEIRDVVAASAVVQR